jgi:glycosyltransferase involved in cell wall biosynthesis
MGAAAEHGIVPRRICMVVHASYPLGEPRVQREAAAAREAGWEVDVVSLRRPGEPAHEVVEGAEVWRLPVSHDRTAGAPRMAFEYLHFAALASAKLAQLDRRRRYDVVHVSNPPDLLVFAGLFPRLRGARLILDVHDLTAEMFAWRFGAGRASAIVEKLLILQERISCRVAEDVITVHDGCADVLRARSVRPSQRLVIVMNSLDERLLADVPREQQHGGWHAPIRLVYHGSLVQFYGVHVLISAFSRLQDLPLELTVIGDGDQREPLMRQARELGVDQRVHFSDGYRPIRETLRAVAASDIGVVPLDALPINDFALPSKLLEYVALGIPAVCARTATISRHFADDELNFFVPGDPDDLAQTLRRVIADEGAARRTAERAVARYAGLRWERSRSRFVELIEVNG